MDHVKGSKDIERTTLGLQTDRPTYRPTDRPTVAKQYAPFFKGGIRRCLISIVLCLLQIWQITFSNLINLIYQNEPIYQCNTHSVFNCRNWIYINTRHFVTHVDTSPIPINGFKCSLILGTYTCNDWALRFSTLVPDICLNCNLEVWWNSLLLPSIWQWNCLNLLKDE